MSNFKILTNKLYKYDPIWQVQLVVVIAILLQVLLPNEFRPEPRWILPALEVILLLALIFTTPREAIYESKVRRINSVALIALISLANIYSLAKVVNDLLAGGRISNGRGLIMAAINIFITNVIIFALWYWEVDGGGPGRRRKEPAKNRDFLFPQMGTPHAAPEGWEPTFLDYLYVSVTNATAFSPTDTLPLTRRVKALMGTQALVSLVTLLLVAARAIGILG